MSDEKASPKANLSIDIGKKIDSALGDVIRSLLLRPAEATGNLFANSIGIIGDQIQRKREENTRKALEQVRTNLESKGVELKDITPPAEEDVHIVLNGMSLTSDEVTMKIWSGLLSSSLDPKSNTKISRPIASLIGSLTPLDARIIDLAAFILRSSERIEREARKIAGLEDVKYLTIGQASKISEIKNNELKLDIDIFFEKADQLFEKYDLESLEPNWADNLIRLGLIHALEFEKYSPQVPSRINLDLSRPIPGKLFDAIYSDVHDIVEHSKREVEISFLMKKNRRENYIRLGFEFTRFGEEFCRSCDILPTGI